MDILPEILNKVLTLEGKWEAKAHMQMGDKSYNFKYFMNFRKIADGNGLYMEENAEIPGVMRLDGGNIIGYDPFDGKLHWFSVDNLGTTHDHIAELVEENHIQLIHESEREGKKFRENIDIKWISDKEVFIKLVATLNDNVEYILEGTFIRKS